MALKNCKECGESISKKATTCPKCGYSEKKTPIIVKLIIGVFIFALISAALSDNKETVSAKPVVKVVKKISNLKFKTIRNQIEVSTEAQFKGYCRSIKGTKVKWSGYVEDVNEKTFGGYELFVDMDSPYDDFSVQDITFDIPDDIAMKLRKDSKVTFVGEIGFIMNMLGSCQIKLENVTLQ